MQSAEVNFQSAFERGQRLGCSDVHRSFHHRGARTESSREQDVQA